MCVCMCVCVHIYNHIYINIFIYIYMYVYFSNVWIKMVKKVPNTKLSTFDNFAGHLHVLGCLLL